VWGTEIDSGEVLDGFDQLSGEVERVAEELQQAPQ
jgi:hypothetical protein